MELLNDLFGGKTNTIRNLMGYIAIEREPIQRAIRVPSFLINLSSFRRVV